MVTLFLSETELKCIAVPDLDLDPT
jgi:hypothetical protein